VWRTPPGLPTPTTATTWRGVGKALHATVRWRVLYVGYDLREVHWLLTDGGRPVGPSGGYARSRRLRRRRELRAYWALRQGANALACVWIVVSLGVVTAAYLVAPYYAFKDLMPSAASLPSMLGRRLRPGTFFGAWG